MKSKYLFIIFFIFIPLISFAAQDYSKVEDYLNSIKTFSADFKQYGSDGTIKEGRFLLSKPGRIKWEYLSPKKVVIIGNGKNIVYCDYELEEVSHISTKSVLARFLSKEKINLLKDVTVEKYVEGNRYSELIVSEKKHSTKESQISKLILKFEHEKDGLKESTKLIEIDIIDVNDQEVEILFNNVKVNISLDKSEFIFKNPKFFTNLK